MRNSQGKRDASVSVSVDLSSVLHVVPQLSRDMDFGGPVRVAVNIGTEQARRGLKIVLAGAAIRSRGGVHSYLGLDARRHRGFQLIGTSRPTLRVSPGLWTFVARVARTSTLIHVHMGRDFVSLVAAMVAVSMGGRVIAQTHGMIEAPRSASIRILDRVATRYVFRRAHAVLSLTPSEVEYANRLAGRPIATRLPNGIPTATEPRGAHGKSEQISVLFLGRLHPRKGAAQLARVAARPDFPPGVRVVIAGPDEGDLEEVERYMASQRASTIEYLGAIRAQDVESVMAEADLYVLPAPNEPFGMTILEALNVGTPVVLHASAVLAEPLERAGAARTFDGTDDHLLEVLASATANRDALIGMGSRGQTFVRDEYSITKVVDSLSETYGDSD